MAVDDFRWTHFSRGTLQELARASGLRVSHAATDLADRYGEPPAEAFVADVWPALRDGWFKRTPSAREELVTVLRTARLGRTGLSVRTRAGQMEYLRSCARKLPITRASWTLDFGSLHRNSECENRSSARTSRWPPFGKRQLA